MTNSKADTKIIVNNSRDVMMTSFLTKKGIGSIRHLGSATLIYSNVFHFTILLKTRN